MLKENNFVFENKSIKYINDAFEKMGIFPSQYPSYSNPDEFGKNFKKCTILKEVPLFTTDSSQPPKGYAYA
ncbi:MAG: hypothetical protein HQK75_10550 [Candidatus Magnetomorum sp.]|nr:hypothetical protein [Candidatus Magnetomorum sp.]